MPRFRLIKGEMQRFQQAKRRFETGSQKAGRSVATSGCPLLTVAHAECVQIENSSIQDPSGAPLRPADVPESVETYHFFGTFP